MTIKVSDYIARFIASAGVRHVFMVTGGGAMHLNDSLAKHPQLTPVFNHHEQACAMAAESYTRLSGRLAAVNVTSGPGGINALNGVFGAYTDSIPMLVISGQVRFDTTVQSLGRSMRQLGDQEFPGIIDCARTMTKYATTVTDPLSIRFHLEKACALAQSGRPGPVWLDIPMNVQGAMVEEADVDKFFAAACSTPEKLREASPVISQQQLVDVIAALATAERPVIYMGTGVRLAGAVDDFLRMAERLGVPVVSGFTAHDIMATDHPLYTGRPGANGDRAGNFAVQNADVLLIIGCRLNIRQIGYNWTTFARAAKKIMVDIDAAELEKPTLSIDIPVHADAGDFIRGILQAQPTALPKKSAWVAQCMQWKSRYPVVLPEYWQREALINPYCFVDALFRQLDDSAAVVCANATACVCIATPALHRWGMTCRLRSGRQSRSRSARSCVWRVMAVSR